MNNRWSRQILAAVLVNSIYAMKNYPQVLFNTALAPLSFLLIVNFVSRGGLVGQAIEGAFVMSMFSNGMARQGDLSHLKNDLKLQDMVVSTPTTPGVYVLGMALSEIVYSLPALLTLVGLTAIFVHPDLTQAVELLGVMLLMFTVSVTIGFTLSTFSSDIVQSFAFSGLISTLFTTLPLCTIPSPTFLFPTGFLPTSPPTPTTRRSPSLPPDFCQFRLMSF